MGGIRLHKIIKFKFILAFTLTALSGCSNANDNSSQEPVSDRGGLNSVVTNENNIFSAPIISLQPNPQFKITQLTTNNRHHPTMMGGWGPHLRGLMRNSKDELWFAVDRAATIEVNQAIDYYKFNGQSWSLIGTQNQLQGIQQNTAHLMTNNRYVLSYGVSSHHKGIQECYFDTLNTSYKACNIIYVGGQRLYVDTNTNYIGAAVAPDSATRIVWWVTVGPNGSGGHLNYIFNDGWVSRERTGLWRGPYKQHLSGYSHLGYVYGRLINPYTFHGAGQLFTGVYPSGTYQSTALDITLGQPHALQLLWSTPTDYSAGLRLDSVEDSIQAPSGSSQHILARSFTGKVAYVYRPVGATHQPVEQYFAGVYRGRLHLDSEHFTLILASLSKNEIYIRQVPASAANQMVDWSKAPVTTVTVGDASLGGITAIYIEGTQTQSLSPTGLNFAVTGGGGQTHYPNGGKQIWHLQQQ